MTTGSESPIYDTLIGELLCDPEKTWSVPPPPSFAELLDGQSADGAHFDTAAPEWPVSAE
ncbi:hypothetical protein [Saccharopolyspora sp. NPDC002686]|uniref:hypothetical protein n=1 Tax=Saccharopolyspora sp. NPDC002686 TaxID=3154541 RepID=UPI003332A931